MACDLTVYRRAAHYAAAWRRLVEEERRRRLRRKAERSGLRVLRAPAGP